jgi:hypothetical protein
MIDALILFGILAFLDVGLLIAAAVLLFHREWIAGLLFLAGGGAIFGAVLLVMTA